MGDHRRLAEIKAEMKRFGNLYDKIISIENLDLAERKARKGKGKRKDVAEFDKDKNGNLRRLHETLARGEFKTSEYTTFTVYEPKERVIFKLPYFPDRVVHHAIMNVLEPIWTRTFTHNTFSCIKGRGISGCARAVEKIIKTFKGRPLYCLKIDIRKFYPSVDGGARATETAKTTPNTAWTMTARTTVAHETAEADICNLSF